jgi:hypothetical protein
MKLAGWLMVAACIIVFALRIYIAFSNPGLSGDEAYFNLRQIENIRNTGLPLYNDPLSFGGREYFFSPVFHYIVAAGALIMPMGIAVKVIPNLLATFLIPIVFLIVRRLSKQDAVALFISIFSAFVPVWFGHTINTLSPITLAIPLLFFVIYCMLRVNEPHWRYVYLCALILLSFTHPLVLLLVLGLIFYMVLVLVEQLKIERAELEITLFSVFFILWSQFLVYKNVILAHGPAVIWQNIPAELLSMQFANITILSAIYQIGILPVLYGVFVVYRYLFRRKHKITYFLIAFTLAAAVLLWFRLIPIQMGMMLLGMFLLVLFSRWVDFFFSYIPTTRMQRLAPLFITSLVLAFTLTAILPSWSLAWSVEKQTLPQPGINAYEWIRKNTESGAVVVASVDEGNRITALAERKNVIDSHFITQRDSKQRLHDIGRIFTTSVGVEAAELMERYDAGVILLSPETKEQSRIITLRYADRSTCFSKTFSEGGYDVFVKREKCRVEVIS